MHVLILLLYGNGGLSWAKDRLTSACSFLAQFYLFIPSSIPFTESDDLYIMFLVAHMFILFCSLRCFLGLQVFKFIIVSEKTTK
uniref:Uncharacterized protein n=1 Tax=Aegilops tauschii subsp. strangulata TaxID=200361 RepID=A0A453KL06_AEGTS